ncbi:ABC transporter permease [Microtetraspora fusca]|uniref:ABC transporter permease n=1 Tax=Microtetraspora fusca TaxID=1997 RepID=A0ABW6V027_MICFU|nr:ABC transporter permease [Microtetraspora fusca]
MLAFIARRLAISCLVLLAATFIMFVLVALSGDPLADLREQSTPQAQAQMAARTAAMRLDVPVPVRYLGWLGDLLHGNLGVDKSGNPVSAQLAQATAATLQLVIVATLLGAFIGVTIGIISALRQYSSFDHGITFAAFVCFSLPVFWVATMLKQYVAIEFNDWLRDPVIPTWVILAAAVFAGLVWASIYNGGRRGKLIAFGIGLVVTAVILYALSASRWFADPGLGFPFVLVVSLAAAAGVAVLVSGWENLQPMYAALAAAGVGALLYYPLQQVLSDANMLSILGLGLLTIVVSWVLGHMLGGLLRRQAIPVAIFSGLLTGGLIFFDRLLQAWGGYVTSVRGRPVATIGSETPNYTGDFWNVSLDASMHLLLPTLALILIGLAGHSRYSRASMLEVMNHDYVRTARAKGLPERTVIIKHAFRNGMIPITTILALDFAGVFSGAVVTEHVFGWRGLGEMFNKALKAVDPMPIMGFFLVAGAAIVIWNMIADIAYAYLDPRIRLS